jgi:hypothetical protein
MSLVFIGVNDCVDRRWVHNTLFHQQRFKRFPRSRVAEALPHSEGIAYKPPCGEITMCPRVGRMGMGPNK